MLAVSNGRMICLSTPYGKRGFFYEAWATGQDWTRIEVPAERISRITPEFLEKERRDLGESYFRQEYCCFVREYDFAIHLLGLSDRTAPARSRLGGTAVLGYTSPHAQPWQAAAGRARFRQESSPVLFISPSLSLPT